MKCKKELYAVCLRFSLGINHKKDEKHGDSQWLHAKFCMLTYFDTKWSLKRGKWGPLDDISRFEELCRRDPYVKTLIKNIGEDVIRLGTETFATLWAFSVELCPTLLSQGTLQLHVTGRLLLLEHDVRHGGFLERVPVEGNRTLLVDSSRKLTDGT